MYAASERDEMMRTLLENQTIRGILANVMLPAIPLYISFFIPFLFEPSVIRRINVSVYG
jgi:hypothetical protein